MGKSIIWDFDDPIPRLIQDSDKTAGIFKDSGLIPYASNGKATGDALRGFLKSMAKLSTTHAGCIKQKIDFGFTGNIALVRDNLFTQPVEINESEYVEYVKIFDDISYLNSRSYLNHLRNCAYNYSVQGDVFIQVFLYQKNGRYKIDLSILNNDNSYIYKDKDTKKLFYYWKENNNLNGEATPFFPEFKKHQLGYISVLHIKNGLGYYGEPNSIDSLLNQYSEYINKSFSIRHAENGWMGFTILEYTKSNPSTGDAISIRKDAKNGQIYETAESTDANLAFEIAQRVVNKNGKDQSIFVKTRPPDSTPITVHTIQPSTNEKYFKTMNSIDSEAIIVSHRWSRRLLGMEVSNGMNSNAYIEDFTIKMNTVVSELQDAIMRPHDALFDFLNNLNGSDKLSGINQIIINPLEEKLKTTNI